MHKTKSISSRNIPCFYCILLFILASVSYYWFYPSPKPFYRPLMIGDASHLPQSSLFTYLNLSSIIYLNVTQGLLFIPPHDKPPHFGSIVSKGVRGNHRHKDKDNSLSGEVIVLLDGQFQFRIGDGETDKYEDYHFNVSQIGVIALQFTADKCHALKNIGKQTNWFASYYIKLKDVGTPPVDKAGCLKMVLT